MPSPKHSFNIHSKPGFVKNFFKKFSTFLSGDRIYCLTALEADDQPVGQAHDLSTAGTHPAVHTVMIWTVGFSNTDSATFDGDSVSSTA